MPERFFEIIAELRNYDEWGCGKWLTELEEIYNALKQQIKNQCDTIERMQNSGITDTYYKTKYKRLVSKWSL